MQGNRRAYAGYTRSLAGRTISLPRCGGGDRYGVSAERCASEERHEELRAAIEA